MSFFRQLGLSLCIFACSMIHTARISPTNPQVLIDAFTIVTSAIEEEAVLVNIDQLTDTQIDCMVKKVVPVIQKLTNEQRTACMRFLDHLDKISRFTASDLISAATRCSSNERQRLEINRAYEQYLPLLRISENSTPTPVIIDALEGVDLHNPAFNTLTRYLCAAMRFENFNDLAHDERWMNPAHAEYFQELVEHVGTAIALPYVIFIGDFFYSPQCDSQLRQSGETFKHINRITTRLIAEINK